MEEFEMEAAATRIQARYRGHKTRKGGMKGPPGMGSLAEGEDAAVPAGAMMAGSEEEEKAALKIQSLQRGRAARRK
eukprot:1364121-Pyramimonas_sp.AAC.1